jgi:hypothetical protein
LSVCARERCAVDGVQRGCGSLQALIFDDERFEFIEPRVDLGLLVS